MGRKKDLRRAIKTAEADPLTPPASLAKPHHDDGKLVQVSMFVTSGDRYRLKKLGLNLGNMSLQRLGHRAFNALLASHGQPGLTPVLTGVRGLGLEETQSVGGSASKPEEVPPLLASAKEGPA